MNQEVFTSPLVPSIPVLSPDIAVWIQQELFSRHKQYTVSEWADYVIARKEKQERKAKTVDSYRFLSKRIKEVLGDIPMTAVTPLILSDFFSDIQSQPVALPSKAIVKIPLIDVLSQLGYSKTEYSRVAGIGESTLDRAISKQPVSIKTAEAIAKTLGAPVDSIFTVTTKYKKLSKATIQDYRRFVALIFSTAKRDGIIWSNPMENADLPSYRSRRKIKTLQPDEVQKVLTAMQKEPIQKQVLIHLALITGCRKGELAALRWESINWQVGSILVDREVLYTKDRGIYIEEGTKNGKDRLLRLPIETLMLLETYRTSLLIEPKPEDYLFPGRRGGPMFPDGIYTYIKRFEQRYQLPNINPHKFRHTLASLLLHSGMDVVTVSHRLGHTKPGTTLNMYGSLILKADMESAELVADAILRGKKIENP